MTIRFLQYAAGFCLPAFCGRFLHLSNGFSPTDVFSYGIFQFSSVAQSRLTLCDPMNCSPPGFPVHHQLLELAQTHVCRVHVAIQHPILCCPLLLPPSIFPSIRAFSNESVLQTRWSKDWSFNFSISPSNEYSGLTTFRIDSFYFLTVQGSLKSLLQHHRSKASILWCSAFFMVQLSLPYMTAVNIIALTIQIFASKVMSLLFQYAV